MFQDTGPEQHTPALAGRGGVLISASGLGLIRGGVAFVKAEGDERG